MILNLTTILKLVLSYEQYVALQTAVNVDEVEIYLVKDLNAKFNPITPSDDLIPKTNLMKCKEKLQVLREDETLEELKTDSLTCGYLVSTSFTLEAHTVNI